jgi:hypothetical protein
VFKGLHRCVLVRVLPIKSQSQCTSAIQIHTSKQRDPNHKPAISQSFGWQMCIGIGILLGGRGCNSWLGIWDKSHLRFETKRPQSQTCNLPTKAPMVSSATTSSSDKPLGSPFLFRCMDLDGRCALGLGFYWEDAAVIAGLGYGTRARSIETR